MARNKIEDLRDHLFEQIERLNNEDLSGEKLQDEVEKAKAMSEVAKVIVDSAKVEVEYLKVSGRSASENQFLLPSSAKPKQLTEK